MDTDCLLSTSCVCCVGPLPPMSTCTTSVCSPPNGRTIASMIALLTTSWYFSKFNSCPKIRFKFVGAEYHHSLHCTTHGTSTLKSNSMLKNSASCWMIVLADNHSWSTKMLAQTQCVQIQDLLLFLVENLSSCQSSFGVDLHARGKFGCHPSFFILPSVDLVHHLH